MPYNGKRKARSTRKATRRTPKGGSRRSTRGRKYPKVSRKRQAWQAATTVSPYRKFIYNDSAFEHVHAVGSFNFVSVFRGNSLYDPDYSGVGVQPYGYDQLCPTFYNNYFVKSSKITVYPSTLGNSSNAYFEILVVPYRASSLVSTDPDDVRRMPYCRSLRLTSSTISNKACFVSSYASTSAILSKEFGTDTLASGQYDGDPTYVWYWHVVTDSSDYPVGANTKVKFDVKIAYYTKLMRKQEFIES